MNVEYSLWGVTLLVLLSAAIFGYISVRIQEQSFLTLAILSAAFSWIPFIQIMILCLYVCAGIVYGSYFLASLILLKVKIAKQKSKIINGEWYF